MNNKTSKLATFKQPLPRMNQELKKKPLQRHSSLKNKNPPVVRQTLTSTCRLLNANPLLKYEMEGKNIDELLNKKSNQSLSPNHLLNGTDKSKSKQVAVPKAKSTCTKPINGLRRSLSAQNFNMEAVRIAVNDRFAIKYSDDLQSSKVSSQTETSNQAESPKTIYTFSPLTRAELNKRLNAWLKKRGKPLGTFTNLRTLGEHNKPLNEVIDEEDKENIELDDRGSYEDLKLEGIRKSEKKNSAQEALNDLSKLVTEGCPWDECEAWLTLIRNKYKYLESEPHYWQCRAAVEQSRGNISSAVECFKTAIVHGANVQAVDESLDKLLHKFRLLSINADRERNNEDRKRVLKEARNVFKSSIIQCAIQKRTLRK